MSKCLIMGYGNIGKIHAKYLSKNNFEWFWYDPVSAGPETNRIKQLIFLDKFDYVFITSPERHHYENYKFIRNNGYQGRIFVEKPAATERQHIKEMLADDRLMVGMIERFNPAVIKLKQILEKDKIISLDFYRCGPCYDSRDVSAFEDIGIHDIDILFFLLNLESIEKYNIQTKNKTTTLTINNPMCRMLWSNDTFFKDRKIIVREIDCTYEVDLVLQSIIKHWSSKKHHVSESLFVERASPMELEHRYFFEGGSIDCKKSHITWLDLLNENR